MRSGQTLVLSYPGELSLSTQCSCAHMLPGLWLRLPTWRHPCLTETKTAPASNKKRDSAGTVWPVFQRRREGEMAKPKPPRTSGSVPVNVDRDTPAGLYGCELTCTHTFGSRARRGIHTAGFSSPSGKRLSLFIFTEEGSSEFRFLNRGAFLRSPLSVGEGAGW